MRIPSNYEFSLTGRVRARPGWFGRQVLQVEVATLEYSACPPMPGSNAVEWRHQMKDEGETTFTWRDATWADVQALTEKGALAGRAIEPTRPWPRGPNVNPPPTYARPPAPPNPPPAPYAGRFGDGRFGPADQDGGAPRNPIPQPDPQRRR